MNLDLVGFIRSIEELIYEITTWVVLLPKTLIKVIINPGWIREYVTEEFKKEPEKRFDDYLSPFIFWFLLGVTPFLLFVVINAENQEGIKQFTGDIFEPGIILICNLIFPIIYSAGMLIISKENIARISFRRPLYFEAMLFAPVFLVFWSIYYFSNVVDIFSSIRSGGWKSAILVLMILWVLWGQQKILKQELARNWVVTLLLNIGLLILATAVFNYLLATILGLNAIYPAEISLLQ